MSLFGIGIALLIIGIVVYFLFMPALGAALAVIGAVLLLFGLLGGLRL